MARVIEAQRLRNLTTGKLHTEMGHIYEDLGWIFGSPLMTHQLPNAIRSAEPWLRAVVQDQRFWDGEMDQDHAGAVELPEPSEEERREMLERYQGLPHPFERLAGIQRLTGEGSGL